MDPTEKWTNLTSKYVSTVLHKHIKFGNLPHFFKCNYQQLLILVWILLTWLVVFTLSCLNVNNKRLLHDIFHIGPGISLRLPYQARQQSWRADMGRGLIPGTIWKISCHDLFITYFTLTFILQKRSLNWQIAKINP